MAERRRRIEEEDEDNAAPALPPTRRISRGPSQPGSRRHGGASVPTAAAAAPVPASGAVAASRAARAAARPKSDRRRDVDRKPRAKRTGPDDDDDGGDAKIAAVAPAAAGPPRASVGVGSDQAMMQHRENRANRKARNSNGSKSIEKRLSNRTATSASTTSTERLASNPTTLNRTAGTDPSSGDGVAVGAFAYTSSAMPPDHRSQKANLIANYTGQHRRRASPPPPSDLLQPSPQDNHIQEDVEQPLRSVDPMMQQATVVAARVVKEEEDPYKLEHRLRAEFREEKQRLEQEVRNTLLQEVAIGEVVVQDTDASRRRRRRSSNNDRDGDDDDDDSKFSDSDDGGQNKNRKWLWILLIVLVVGGGVGAGVGIATSNRGSGSSDASNNDDTPAATSPPSTNEPANGEIILDYGIIVKDGLKDDVPATLYTQDLNDAMDLLAPEVLDGLIGQTATAGDVNNAGRHLEPSIVLPTSIKTIETIDCPDESFITSDDKCEKISASVVINDDDLFNVQQQFLRGMFAAINDGSLQTKLEQVNNNARVRITEALFDVAPTPAPSMSDFARTRDLLFPVSGNLLLDASTPQYKALSWLVLDDPQQIIPDTIPVDDLRQRYVAALLYFATAGDDWKIQYNFLSVRHICDWNDGNGINDVENGIACDDEDESVAFISLEDNYLSGTIPAELQLFSTLWYLDFEENQLHGTIPTELGTVIDLSYLHLARNQLTGTIPPSIANLPYLQRLWLFENELAGPIPSFSGNLGWFSIIDLDFNEGLYGNINDIFNSINSNTLVEFWCNNCFLGGTLDSLDLERFEDLEILSLANADLSGTIPTSLALLSSLARLDLDGNYFLGPIPPELATLSFLEALDLSSNKLNGKIPDVIAAMPSLRKIDLSFNSLTGTVPSFARNNGALEEVELKRDEHDQNSLDFNVEQFFNDVTGFEVTTIICNHCTLSGSLPEGAMTKFRNLEELQLANSRSSGIGIVGSLPTTMGFLINLRSLDLDGNSLTGSIPAELFNAKELEELAMAGNQLNSAIPSELNSMVWLHSVNLNGNSLVGTVPTFENSLAGVQFMDLSENREITGDVGYIFSAMPAQRLETFRCNSCRLQGSLPTSIGDYSALVGLEVTNAGITGSLPTELGQLDVLILLNLSRNQLIGTIPQQVADLQSLQALTLFRNNLSGPIPDFSSNFDVLSSIDLDYMPNITGNVGTLFSGMIPAQNFQHFYCTMCALSGTLPTDIGLYTRLSIFNTKSSKISGSIPSEIGQLSDSLTSFHVRSALLNGAIPTEMSHLMNLQSLDLGGNDLAGNLPNGIGKLPSLWTLSLWGNGALTGAVPTFAENVGAIQIVDLNGLFGLSFNMDAFFTKAPTSLNALKCHGCQARQGTLPASIGNYNRLRFLDLSNAGLTGSIPTELGKATSLEIVTLNFNNLNDTVPAELADLPELHTLQLEGNDLTGIVPQPVCNKLFEFAVTFVTDCFAPVQIECPCCTSCWSDESEGYVYPQTTP